MKRVYKIPEKLESAIESVLNRRFKLSLKDSAKLDRYIMANSDFYIENPDAATPWEKDFCQIAYLSYYLPLNYLRAQAVLDEAHRLHFFDQFDSAIDFGSGLGSASFELPLEKYFLEKSKIAQDIHREIHTYLEKQGEWVSAPQVKAKTLGVFSYVLTEMSKLPDWALQLEGLMIIEPATRDDGRRLLELRKTLLENGYKAWAPCLHQKKCPLLLQSKNDWCSDRIHFDQPAWFKEMEKRLPIRNNTITMSYLLVAKNPPPALQPLENEEWVRVTGDALREKGKTRQMICRNEDREFLAWITSKNAYPETEIPRGSLIKIPTGLEKKANELRWG